MKDHKAGPRSASLMRCVSPEDPPFLIIQGDHDMVVPLNQSERLDKALKGAGVVSRFVRVEGGGHGGFRNPEVPKRVRQFFDKHLRDLPVGTISEGPVPNGGPQAKR